MGDHRARADIGPFPHLHRCNQRRIRPDERSLADLGAVLGNPVIVAGDRAGTDVGSRTNRGVADIAEMIGLGAGLDHRFLDLHEVADVHVRFEPRPGAQPGIGTNRRALAHIRLDKVRERSDHRIVFDLDARSKDHERLHHHVATEAGVRRQKDGLGRDQGDARLQCRLAQTLLQGGLRGSKLNLRVDALHLFLLGLDHDRAAAHGVNDRDRIGQIELFLAVVVADPVKNGEGGRTCEGHQSGIAEIDLALFAAGIELLANGERFCARQHDAAVAARVGWAEPEHDERRTLRQGRPHSTQRLGRNERRIGKDHQDILRAARNGAPGGQYRVRGSAALRLHEEFRGRQNPLGFRDNAVRSRPDHDRGSRPAGLAHGSKRVGEQGLSGDGMQNLGATGVHARALAGREHDGEAGTLSSQAQSSS